MKKAIRGWSPKTKWLLSFLLDCLLAAAIVALFYLCAYGLDGAWHV